MKTKKALGKNLQVRRFSRYLWILFVVFLTLGAIRSFTASGKDLNEQVPAPAVQEEKINYAASIGAVTFAEDFAGQYFRWEP
ncbi:hypothetical protein R0K17_25940, partial [Planococcus sp. SIMBA_143]